jgi:hypothetical protein
LHDDPGMVHDHVVHGATTLVELHCELGGLGYFGDSGISTNIRHQERYLDHLRLANPEITMRESEAGRQLAALRWGSQRPVKLARELASHIDELPAVERAALRAALDENTTKGN